MRRALPSTPDPTTQTNGGRQVRQRGGGAAAAEAASPAQSESVPILAAETPPTTTTARAEGPAQWEPAPFLEAGKGGGAGGKGGAAGGKGGGKGGAGMGGSRGMGRGMGGGKGGGKGGAPTMGRGYGGGRGQSPQVRRSLPRTPDSFVAPLSCTRACSPARARAVARVAREDTWRTRAWRLRDAARRMARASRVRVARARSRARARAPRVRLPRALRVGGAPRRAARVVRAARDARRAARHRVCGWLAHGLARVQAHHACDCRVRCAWVVLRVAPRGSCAQRATRGTARAHANGAQRCVMRTA